MKQILFVTSNSGKVESLIAKLPKGKFKVIQENIELPELQGNTAADVSVGKAKEAFKILKKPLIIQDSAFHINAFNGFPGPYIKYVQQTLGLNGLLKLMENVEDKSCYFEQAVTYIDSKTIKTFVGDKIVGTIATKVSETDSSKAWGIIWKLFIPKGYSKPLAEFSEKEHKQYDTELKPTSEFTYFVDRMIRNV